jgi:hypothetical protein
VRFVLPSAIAPFTTPDHSKVFIHRARSEPPPSLTFHAHPQRFSRLGLPPSAPSRLSIPWRTACGASLRLGNMGMARPPAHPRPRRTPSRQTLRLLQTEAPRHSQLRTVPSREANAIDRPRLDWASGKFREPPKSPLPPDDRHRLISGSCGHAALIDALGPMIGTAAAAHPSSPNRVPFRRIVAKRTPPRLPVCPGRSPRRGQCVRHSQMPFGENLMGRSPESTRRTTSLWGSSSQCVSSIFCCQWHALFALRD